LIFLSCTENIDRKRCVNFIHFTAIGKAKASLLFIDTSAKLAFQA